MTADTVETVDTPDDISTLDGPTITHIGLSLDLINAVLGYLSKQPYADVANLMAAITRESEASIAAQKG